MRALVVAFYGMKEIMRDIGSLVEMLILPIGLIFILGAALGSSFEPGTIRPSTVAFYSEDQGIGVSTLMEFLETPEIAQHLEVIPVQTRSVGEEMVEDRQADALLVLEQTFSQHFLSQDKAEVMLYTNPGNPFRTSIVENLLETFVVGANVIDVQLQFGSVSPAFNYQQGLIKEVPITAQGNTPRAIDYYAVTMLIMTLLYGSMYASYGMGQDFLEARGRRLRATPLTGTELFIGKTLGFVGAVFAQGLVLVAFTHFVYKVNWGDSLGMVLFIILLFSLFSIGLGTVVAMVTKEQAMRGTILNVLVPLFTLIAGGYVPISRPGLILGFIQRLSPSYLGQTALFNTIYGGPSMETWSMLLSLFALCLIVFAVASYAGRRSVA